MDGGVFPHLGREIEFAALGKRWKLARLTMDVWAEIWKWVQPRLPDAFEGLDKLADKMQPEAFALLVTRAQERAAAMRTLESREAKQLLDSVEGSIEQFYCQLRVNHPDVSRDMALEILVEIGREEAERMKTETEGAMPESGKDTAPAV